MLVAYALIVAKNCQNQDVQDLRMYRMFY